MRLENPTRVLLADYPGPGRTAVTALVGGLPGTTLVASVEHPAQILPMVEEIEPHVVIVDDRLVPRDERWLVAGLGARLIVIGMDDNPAYRRRAMRLGAEAWVAKDRADVLLPALLADGVGITQQG